MANIGHQIYLVCEIADLKIFKKGGYIMKIFKKLHVLSLALLLIFPGCKNDKKYKIGIIQIIEHEALDSAQRGFMDELRNLGYGDEDVSFDFQNAGGDLSVCAQIANKFVNIKCDLILAISTPAAQACANATKDIPILITAITNPEASGLVVSNKKSNINITGTSDLAPVEKQIELIVKFNPSVRKIGVLYSSIDTSPQYQAEIADKKIKDLNLESKMFAISQLTEVRQVAEVLSKEVDALYVPVDKITAAAMPLISEIFLNNGKFVVCSENTLVSKGAAGTYGMDYYELGKLTAHQAKKILTGETKPQDMPIEYLNDTKLTLNYEVIEKLGLKIPDKSEKEEN
jgi:putative ABC transport system substrate-binding protein